MAYPKYSSSLALIALVLIAMASLMANCQATLPELIPPILPSVSVVGVISCGLTPPGSGPPPPIAVSVILSCDGGVTALVPAVATSADGVFAINVPGTRATLVDPMRCAVFAMGPVAGCGPLKPGEALRAPIVLVSQLLPPFFGFIRLLISTTLGVVKIG